MNKRKAGNLQLRQVRPRFPALRQHGFAVEYFPRYINRHLTQHAVDVVLLSVIVRGRGRHFLGDEVRRETGGSVAVTHYGQKHDIVTDARGMAIYNVYLDLRHHPLPEVPGELRAILSSILPVHPRLQHHLNRRVWIRLDHTDDLAASLARIEKEMRGDRPGAREVIQHSFQVFLIDVCRAAQRHGLTPSIAPRSHFPAWAEKLRLDLESDFAAPHDLSSLARRAGVSIAYLCRIFKTYTGKTVMAYLLQRRIQAAIWKLREEGDEKIISIALGCGFNDLAYFNRVFKRVTKMTPSQYRRRLRKGALSRGARQIGASGG